MEPKLVNKGFTGWSQLGVFLGMCGVGLIVGTIASIGAWSMMTGRNLVDMQQDLMNPQFATAVKMVQLLSTLFIFFLPAVFYAFICYRNGWLALGFRSSGTLTNIGICLLVLVASLPLIEWLSIVNKSIPLPAASRSYFDEIEKSYEDQVKVIGDVKTTGQYLLSLFIIALLPAIFEETLFRGTLQNMLSRWKNNSYVYVFVLVVLVMAAKAIWLKNINPWLFYGVLIVLVLLVLRSRNTTDALNRFTNHYLFPIILTSILFSAVHASWYGFIPRFVLGVILGLLFYKTNNIWYNILVHFLNNAFVVTVMFVYSRQHKSVTEAEEQGFPWWTAVVSVAVVILLFRLLAKQPQLPKPVEVTDDRSNPFSNTIFEPKQERE